MPGLTAIHDSEWLESNVPARHVPGFGNVCPGGTGYPPPVVRELATWLVNGTLDVQRGPLAAAAPGLATPAAGVAASPAPASMGTMIANRKKYMVTEGHMLSQNGDVLASGAGT